MEELGGISKSLFSFTEIIPRTKKSNAGFVRLSSKRLKFIYTVSFESCIYFAKLRRINY